jgi:hypothetical protein
MGAARAFARRRRRRRRRGTVRIASDNVTPRNVIT